MEIKGNVVFKKMYVGSKSEHEAVCLHTAEDAYIKLRRPGENPFRDEVLVGLVGKNVTLGGDFFKPISETNQLIIS